MSLRVICKKRFHVSSWIYLFHRHRTISVPLSLPISSKRSTNSSYIITCPTNIIHLATSISTSKNNLSATHALFSDLVRKSYRSLFPDLPRTCFILESTHCGEGCNTWTSYDRGHLNVGCDFYLICCQGSNDGSWEQCLLTRPLRSWEIST